MALIALGRTGVGVLMWLAVNPAVAPPSDAVTAIATRLEGRVTLGRESAGGLGAIRLAVQRQAIRSGESVHIPAGAMLDLICSTDTLVRLTGPRDWTLDLAGCRQGAPLPGGSYRALTWFGGRVLPRNGTLLLELAARSTQLEPGLSLLGPRNTAVMEVRPNLVWTRAANAVEYEIELRGAVSMSIRLPAREVSCGPGSGPWRSLDVCSWSAAGRWPMTAPSAPLFLRIGFRTAPNAPLRLARELAQLSFLPAERARVLREDLRRIAELPLLPVDRLLLSAGLAAQAGLTADAIEGYEQALESVELPAVRATLGDLYLSVGLTDLAERQYRMVAQGAAPAAPADAAAPAAAELGLGCVEYLRTRFSDAAAHFEHARQLYSRLGLSEEEEAAKALLAHLVPASAP